MLKKLKKLKNERATTFAVALFLYVRKRLV